MNLTVVIPTYKRPQKLSACLASLERQSVRPDLVVVTARTEDTATMDFLSDWSSRTALSVKIIEVTLPGVIHAENQAVTFILADTASEIVTFMDDDAVAFDNWIEKIKIFFAHTPEAAAFGGPDIIFTEQSSYFDVRVKRVGEITWFGKIIGNHHRRSEGLREVDVLKGVNMSVRRKYLQALDGHLQGEDPAKGNGVFWELDLCLSIAASGGKIFFDPQLLIHHDSNHSHFQPVHVVSSTAHNLTFVMLKHLSLPKKVVFLTYSLLIGNGHVLGLTKTLFECLRLRSLTPLQLQRSSLRGFKEGLLLYLRLRENDPKLRK